MSDNPTTDLRRQCMEQDQKIIGNLMDENDRLTRQCARYEGYIENLEKRIAQARGALGMKELANAD